jgi:hypothetical protein
MRGAFARLVAALVVQRGTMRTSPRSSNGETRVLEPIGFLLVHAVRRDGREIRRRVEVSDATSARGLRARRDAGERRKRPTEHRGVRGDTRSDEYGTVFFLRTGTQGRWRTRTESMMRLRATRHLSRRREREAV